jgi:hypothetical protein
MPGRAREHQERGLSLVEVLVVLSLMLVIGGVMFELMIGTTRSSIFAEGQNDLATIGQRVVNSIQTEVIQSKLIFQEDAIGTGYRTLFTNALTPKGYTVWSNSRMPIIDANTSIIGTDPGPNAIANRTGNSIILVKQLQPISVSYDHDANSGTPDINFQADVYQLEFYFLRQNTARSFNGIGYYLELIQANSQIVGDYFQLSSIPVNGSQVVQGLRTALLATAPSASTLAWDPGKAVSAPAFYTLNSNGSMTGNATPVFDLSSHGAGKVVSLMPEFSGGRISGNMEYSIGLNASAMTLRDIIPRYATANSNFPGGLEFQIVGPAASRKVLCRLVLAYESMRTLTSRESIVITSARGF